MRYSIEENWDKDRDVYEDVYREDIVARIKALGINSQKNVPLY